MVRTARRTRGFTLGDVARALGVSVSYLSEVEHGHRSPFDVDVTVRLAGILNVEAHDLIQAAAQVRGMVQFKSADPARMELAASLARHLEHLTPEEMGELHAFLRKKGES